MDSDQDLLDAHNAREDVREAAEWKQKKAAQQRYEDAAKQAHAFRNAARLVCNFEVIRWEKLHLSSKNHLIADAENAAANPSITAVELNRLYKERLIAWGDTDSPDLGVGDENTPMYQGIEEIVLEHLKKCLADSSNPPPESIMGLS